MWKCVCFQCANYTTQRLPSKLDKSVFCTVLWCDFFEQKSWVDAMYFQISLPSLEIWGKNWRSVQNICPTLVSFSGSSSSRFLVLLHQSSLSSSLLLAGAEGNVKDQAQPLSSVVRLTQTSLCLLATTSRCRQRESRVMAPLPLCLSLLSHCSSIN